MKKKKATANAKRVPKKTPSGRARPRPLTKPVQQGLTPQQVLEQAGTLADDPNFVRIMNEVYLETRGRLCFDNHNADLHS
jgi:hypothetical protein